MRRWFIAVIAAALVFGVSTASAQPTRASKSAITFCSTDHVHFAKTKFVFHAGLAYAAFHHFIWNPYKAGDFKKGAPHRLKTSIKAGAAALVVYHELSEACKDANSSSLLRPLVHPLTSVITAFHKVVDRFKQGNVSDSEVGSLSDQMNAIQKASPVSIG